MPPMSLAIEIRGLAKSYPAPGGRRQALQGLDLEVAEGAIFGFIGPNGAGKSTTIKTLVGLVHPDRGEARVLGHPCGSPESRRKLGFLPESPLYPDFMTAGEILESHARLAGIPRNERRGRALRVLQEVGLADRMGERLRAYSKGMKERFGIAAALLADPRLLILDEPTSGLDPLAQREVKEIILRLRDRGITIFFSSHQLTEVEEICDVIGILARGRLLCCRPLDELLGRGDRVEIRFQGEPPLDLEGELSRARNGDNLLVVPREKADASVDRLRGAGVSLVSLKPVGRTLEEAFFQVIREAES